MNRYALNGHELQTRLESEKQGWLAGARTPTMTKGTLADRSRGLPIGDVLRWDRGGGAQRGIPWYGIGTAASRLRPKLARARQAT